MLSVCDLPRGLLSLEEARKRLEEALSCRVGTEVVPLSRVISRRAAESIRTPIAFPPFTNAAMDGVAVRAADALPGAELQLLGTVLAGDRGDAKLAPGGCVRIYTGAPLPEGADAVVIQEDIQIEGERVRRLTRSAVRPGDHVRLQGEERSAGAVLLGRGQIIGPYEAGLLAFAGISTVPVMRRLKVGLLATGDELVPPGGPCGPGQIHESNRPVLEGLIDTLGHEVVDLGFVPDQREVIRERLLQGVRGVDALITTGGASEGVADHLAMLVKEVGQLEFWKVAIKPGKPFLFGWLEDHPVFGLPGNPVSAAITFLELVRPALDRMAGAPLWTPRVLQLPLVAPLNRAPGRSEFLRAQLVSHATGTKVLPLTQQGSHCLTSLAQADCLIRVEPEVSHLPQGALVEVELLPGAVRDFGVRLP